MPIQVSHRQSKATMLGGMEKSVATAYSGRKRGRPVPRTLVSLECGKQAREMQAGCEGDSRAQSTRD